MSKTAVAAGGPGADPLLTDGMGGVTKTEKVCLCVYACCAPIGAKKPVKKPDGTSHQDTNGEKTRTRSTVRFLHDDPLGWFEYVLKDMVNTSVSPFRMCAPPPHNPS